MNTTSCMLLALCPLACGQQYTISTLAGAASQATPIAAVNASLGPVFGVAVSPSGAPYFVAGAVSSGFNNAFYGGYSVFRVETDGTLDRVAGTGFPGYSGDGGPAINAELNGAFDLAFDNSGNLYIAETANHAVRKVSPDGIITTVAGTGTAGYSGDGGPAARARLKGPGRVAAGPDGSLYIADYSAVRKVAVSGTITTVAGTGVAGHSGDGGLAVSAQLHAISGLAVNASGEVFIVDVEVGGLSHIRKVSKDGIISAVLDVPGTGNNSSVTALTLDSAGNFLIGVNNTVAKVSPTGVLTPIAGTTYGYSGDGGPALKAQLWYVNGLAVGSAGNIYIADEFNNRLRVVSTGGTITTVAGNGTHRFSGDGGPAMAAMFGGPDGMALDSQGNLLFVDGESRRVRKISRNGVISTVAGNGIPGYGGDGGPAVTAQLNFPRDIAIDHGGSLYIAEANRVRKVSPDGIISTVAGTGTENVSGGGDGRRAVDVPTSTNGIAVDRAGNLYIAAAYVVRKVSPAGIITTIAGTGTSGYSGDGGPALAAKIASVRVAADDAGNVFFSDTLHSVVRKVSADGMITTVAGVGAAGFYGDGGPASRAALYYPWGLAIDGDGSLYIADARNGRVRKVYPSGIIQTIAGVGQYLDVRENLSATSVGMAPQGVAVDASGNVYIGDYINQVIRIARPAGPLLATGGIQNAASNAAGSIAPGEIVIVRGFGTGPGSIAPLTLSSNGSVSSMSADTRVLFNGVPGPIVYSWSTQVAAIVPYSIGGTSARVQVQYQGQLSNVLTVGVVSSAPALFTADSTGTGLAAALNQDGSYNTLSAPASAGSVVTLFATGEGQTSPAGVDGKPASTPLPKPMLPVTVTIGGRDARVLYAGGAPGEVAGVMQVNVEIPNGTGSGNVPVILQVGGGRSQAGVFLAVLAN